MPCEVGHDVRLRQRMQVARLMRSLALASRRILFLAGLIPATLLVGCAKPEVRAQSYYDKAMELIAKKEDVPARVELLNALKYKSDKLDAWRALAGVNERTGDLKALFVALKRVVELDPSDTDARLRLARFMVQGGAAEAAQGLIANLDDSDKPNAELHALRALISLRLKDQNNALVEAQKASEIDPINKDAAILLAYDRASKSKFDDALQILAKADTGTTPNPQLSALRIQILLRKGDPQKAEAELKTLVAANPREIIYYAQLANLYSLERKFDDAERELRTITDMKPTDVRAGLDLVRFLQRTKGFAAAQTELESRIKKGGAVFDYQIALAEAEFGQGAVDQSTNLLQSLIAGETTQANIAAARAKLAEFYLAKNNPDAAEKQINEVLAKDRRNTAALKLRATIRLAQGRTDDAIADLREALNDQPKMPDLLILLAQAYERGGKIELADRQYNDAIKASDYNPNLGLAYVSFLQRTRNPARAETILLELTNRNPQNVALLSSLAQLKLTRQDWAGASQVADAVAKLGDNTVLADEIKAASLAGQQKPDDSLALLEHAHATAPDAAQPIVSLVNGYTQQRRFDKALSLLQDTLTKFPDNVQLLVLQGQALAAADQPDKAIASFNAAINRQPQNNLGYIALVQFFSQQKRYDDAIGVIDQGLKQRPNDFDLRLTRAGLLATKNDAEAAIAGFEGLLKEQPRSLIVINNLVSLLLDNRTDKESLDRALQLSENLKNIQIPQFQDTLGWALYHRGDFAGADALLEQAKAQLPNLAAVRYHLAMTYRSLGQQDKAEAELKAALQLESDDTPLKQKIKASLKERG